MTEASRVQNMLNEQNSEIIFLKSQVLRQNLDIVGYRDRIEKLEAALLWYAEHCQKGGDNIEGPYGDYGERARKALEGEND